MDQVTFTPADIALIATVIGLLIAIPAMDAYNFMVTAIRAITQELDNFATEYATAVEHTFVDNRPLGEEIKTANRELADQISQSTNALGDRLVTPQSRVDVLQRCGVSCRRSQG